MKKTVLPGLFRSGKRFTGFRAMLNPGKRGVVLIAVLWICALIMWFAFQISAKARLQGEDELHAIRRSQAFYLAIGGCYEALARMKETAVLALPGRRQDQDAGWKPDGLPRVVQYGTGVAVVISEQNDTKLNVNKTDVEQLRKMIQRAGADEATSEQLADRILDFIDIDDTPRSQGMEKDGYKRAGLSYIPFNGPLTSLDQLLLVPGVSYELFYGYGQEAGADESMREFRDVLKDLPVPGRNSLFSLLTIYGNNANLAQESEEQQQLQQRQAAPLFKEDFNWKAGSVYRVLSFGKTFNGPPSVCIWMEVRLAGGGGRESYKILSRKVM